MAPHDVGRAASGTLADRMPQSGEKASGNLRFDVLAEIAAGTTARIELCRVSGPVDRAGALVAVKRLHKHIAEDRSFADMFFDEVWMTAALHHANVVDVAGWGNDDEGTYLAVELVQGVSLARLMKTVFETGEMFSERMVVFLGSSLCAGLGAAHDLKAQNGELLHLVHRDLTPGNVLIGFNGQIKIADFGLAKAKQRVTKTLTGMLKGHPQYMAPELARGVDIDHRADLFSLGVMLFELFGGRPPWTGNNEVDLIRVTATEPPKDLLSLRPRLDKELAAVVMLLLEKDPAARFQQAADVRARLLTWLDAHGYNDGNEEALGRFVRRNAMRQMRWFERAISGELALEPVAPRVGLVSVADGKPPEKRAGVVGIVGVTKPPRIERGRAPIAPRARRNRRSLDDLSDITDLSAEAPEDLAETSHGRAIDWGEEVPTVVKKAEPPGFKVAVPKTRTGARPNRRASARARHSRYGAWPTPTPTKFRPCLFRELGPMRRSRKHSHVGTETSWLEGVARPHRSRRKRSASRATPNGFGTRPKRRLRQRRIARCSRSSRWMPRRSRRRRFVRSARATSRKPSFSIKTRGSSKTR